MPPLPDLIARTVRDPMTQGNPGEMHRLLDLAETLPTRLGTDPAGVRVLLSHAGAAVREALAAVRAAGDEEALMGLIRRGCGLEPDTAVVATLIPSTRHAQLVGVIAAETGLAADAIVAILPVVVPAVLKLLDAGSSVRHCERVPNVVLEAFLAEGGTWDGDMGEAVRQLMAARREAEGRLMPSLRTQLVCAVR